MRRYLAISLALVITATALLTGATARAQNNNNNNNNNNNGNDNNQDLIDAVGGVIIDADGVVRMQTIADPQGRLHKQRIAAARAALDPDLAKRSPLRKISLNRLEAAIKEQLDKGAKPSDEMRFLAGLTRVQYIFYYPETNDVVLAGPAEGFAPDLAGRVRGLESKSPTLQLDDLVVALRAFFGPAGKQAPLISVSIDPTPEGLQNMQSFLRQIGSRATPGQTQFIVRGLRESLGLQNITLHGVPATSHYAQVLVEADYRMKLIGIGLEKPKHVKMSSYVDRASPASVARNALQRWYFVPDYECLSVADDNQAAELVGNGVKLISADELVSADGTRKQTAQSDKASKAFTEEFTRKYAEIARATPVYTELRNIIDLAIVAAFLHHHKLPEKAQWAMETLLDDGKYSVEAINVPKQVETAVASVWRGSRLMTPVGGGVRIQPKQALASSAPDSEGKVTEARTKAALDGLKPGQWWWD